MKINFKAKSKLEKFGQKIYNLLVENFPQTYFVGGMVRDLLLNIQVHDIDIATSANPKEITELLTKAGIDYSDSNKNFGNVVAKEGKQTVEITTFRQDVKSSSRYPKVKFVATAAQDSLRRDFTVNSLYLKQESGIISNYNNGLTDIQNKKITFIGNAKLRINEDPLRIIRALRFALLLNFSLEKKTKFAIKNNFDQIGNLSKLKIEKEINKIKNRKLKIILKTVIDKPEVLDNYFK